MRGVTAESIESAICTDHLKEADRRFINDFIEALEGISHMIDLPRKEIPHLIKGVNRMIHLLEDDSPDASPVNYFEYLNHGFFKECYALSPNLVIKFCAERNPTESEEALLNAAIEEDIQELFLPTIFLPLPRSFQSTKLDVDDDDEDVFDSDTNEWIPNPEWKDNSILTHICIQERAIPQRAILKDDPAFDEMEDTEVDAWSDNVWRVSAAELGIDPDLEFADKWKGLSGASIHWVRSLIDLYGIDYARRFAYFCQTFPLWDLHSENVGYTLLPGPYGVKLPVILDFFSTRRLSDAAGR